MALIDNVYNSTIYKSRYARYLPEKKRRENWPETVQRLIDFLSETAPAAEKVLREEVQGRVTNLEVLPSMRLLMTAGEACRRNNIAAYNCAYLAVNNKRSFSEALEVLLCGTGIGFSCEKAGVSKLPEVPAELKPSSDVIVVGDSKEGWAKAFRKLLSSLWDGDIPTVDYSLIRPAGARLKTFGGRASGPEPLRKLFDFVTKTLKGAAGRKLTTLEVHDMMCFIGEVVVVGGVRRAALISLSDLGDRRLRDAKAGAWYNDTPYRALSNNSAVYDYRPNAETFLEEWLALVRSKSGERGIFNRGAAKAQASKWGRRSPDVAFGCNPCCLTGETLVLTSKGHERLDSLIGKTTRVWNGSEFSDTVPFFAGHHPIRRVILSDGVTLDCTDNHKFVLKGGERVEAQDLQVGDKLEKFPMPVVLEGENYGSAREAYSQGFYSGDGNTGLKHSWIYEPKYVCMDRLIGTFSDTHRTVARRTWQHGVMRAKNFVPVNGSLEYCINWFAGLLDSDGCVTRTIHGNGFQMVSCDKQFLLDVKLMLTRLGAISKVAHASNERPQTFKVGQKAYVCRATSRLLINNADVLRLSKLGLRTERLGWQPLEAQREATRFVTVKENTPLGITADVFCFDEPKNHTGTFNGVVTGQSEIILRPQQFCNLTEVVIRAEDTVTSVHEKVRIATILGTIQSTLTNFSFLSEEWKKNTEEERLLGVSLTGILDNVQFSTNDEFLPGILSSLRVFARETNERWVETLGIQSSAAITCVKPSGTVSQLVDSASGIHPRHNDYYIRRIRMDNKDPICSYLVAQGLPYEVDTYNPTGAVVFSFPSKAPEHAVTRAQLSALDHLKLWLTYQRHWTEHKPSITVSVRDEEWAPVGGWVFDNFDEISGVAFLPFSDHSYVQAPYENITKEQYEAMAAVTPKVLDWADFVEEEDNTVGTQTLACQAAGCEVQ